jgi:hypothetical protein
MASMKSSLEATVALTLIYRYPPSITCPSCAHAPRLQITNHNKPIPYKKSSKTSSWPAQSSELPMMSSHRTIRTWTSRRMDRLYVFPSPHIPTYLWLHIHPLSPANTPAVPRCRRNHRPPSQPHLASSCADFFYHRNTMPRPQISRQRAAGSEDG